MSIFIIAIYMVYIFVAHVVRSVDQAVRMSSFCVRSEVLVTS